MRFATIALLLSLLVPAIGHAQEAKLQSIQDSLEQIEVFCAQNPDVSILPAIWSVQKVGEQLHELTVSSVNRKDSRSIFALLRLHRRYQAILENGVSKLILPSDSALTKLTYPKLRTHWTIRELEDCVRAALFLMQSRLDPRSRGIAAYQMFSKNSHALHQSGKPVLARAIYILTLDIAYEALLQDALTDIAQGDPGTR